MCFKKYFLFLFIILINSDLCSGQQLTASAGNDKIVCPGSGIIIGGSPTASGGLPPYTYSWSPSTGLSATNIANPTATPTSSIDYIVTVTDDTGAVRTDAMVLYIHDIAFVTAGSDASLCVNQNVTIGSSSNNYSGVTYSWSPGSTLNDSTSGAPVASPGLSSITYTLTTSTPACSSRTDMVTVKVIPTPPIYAGPDTTIKEGAVAILHASGGYSYAWGNTPDITYQYSQSCDVEPIVTTTYYLFGTDETKQCPGYDEVTVFVEKSDDVVIYNTFTPNGDSNNDTWYIGNIQKYPDNKLEVYNRYGKLVYRTSHYSNNWDGRVSGEELPSGTYFYDLDLGKDEGKHHGTITIVR
ncbi:MAG: gliding motility-associated C-terminal protein [Bacteroidetes bacterium]|jgi:gliding motility-associated-like protein|nr:gliding motility-associated C-terminal protein [Bacteroidota bacterium]